MKNRGRSPRNRWLLAGLATLVLAAVVGGGIFAGTSPFEFLGKGLHLPMAPSLFRSEPTIEDEQRRVDQMDRATGSIPPIDLARVAEAVPGQGLKEAPAETREVSFHIGVTGETRTFTVQVAERNGKRYVFPKPGSNIELKRSPDGQRYAFNVIDGSAPYSGIWVMEPDFSVHQVTQDGVGEYDHAALSKMTGYLYWATEPFWSLDGRYIAHVSNRAGVQATGSAASSGQGIWVVDTQTGEEWAVLPGVNETYRIEGWTNQGDLARGIWLT